MVGLNIAILSFDINNESQTALHLSRTTVILFTLLMTIVSGRVIPFFTLRGANTAISMPKLLEHSVLVMSILSVLAFAAGPSVVSINVFIAVMLLTRGC